jgi:hypothetical protein
MANLVDPWRGDSGCIAVHEFFESINEAAEMGRLSSKAQSHLKEEEYEEFQAAFINNLSISRQISIIMRGYKTLHRIRMRVPKCI